VVSGIGHGAGRHQDRRRCGGPFGEDLLVHVPESLPQPPELTLAGQPKPPANGPEIIPEPAAKSGTHPVSRAAFGVAVPVEPQDLPGTNKLDTFRPQSPN